MNNKGLVCTNRREQDSRHVHSTEHRLRYQDQHLLQLRQIHRRLDLDFVEQRSGQKSGGDSAVSSEFLIAGMIFHPSRVKS